ncbi:hypothetical protein [Membranihabitans maritimus]|uniref:hypothetical protein n=1 Tax=Membranihabitans maritimus TaxID=2904244 RepID=UPI001F3BFCE8|nr:hypothetical protein [Membranihabitans maritimus]
MTKKINRRNFCQNTLLSSAALAFPGSILGQKEVNDFPEREANKIKGDGPEIIDTYVQLFDYPFRNLKYSQTGDLINKLRKHKISEAWAGSFEHLFHKNIDLANRKLRGEVDTKGKDMLVPVGSVNLTWPDWEEDLRRCKEEYQMDIVRIFPLYQMNELSGEKFEKFVQLATRYQMLIQIVGDVEDRRHHHPLLEIRNIDFAPLVDIGKKYSKARIQLLHWNRRINKNLLGQMTGESHHMFGKNRLHGLDDKILKRLGDETNIVFDISRVEGAGEVGGLIHGDSWYGPDTKIPAERFLFGSYAPYFPVESALLKLFEYPMSESELRSIMRDNAEKLLKI